MQAVGELAGGVAHDFKQPADRDLGPLRPADAAARPERSRLPGPRADQSERQPRRGPRRELLAFSRKQTLEPETIDLRDTMPELVHLLNRLVGEKITLTLSHDPGLLPIRADRRQLDQVIMEPRGQMHVTPMPNGGEITRRDPRPAPDRAALPRSGRGARRPLTSSSGSATRGTGFRPTSSPASSSRSGPPSRDGRGHRAGLVHGLRDHQADRRLHLSSTAWSTWAAPSPSIAPSTTQRTMRKRPPTRPAAIAGGSRAPTGGPARAVVLLVEDEAPVRAFCLPRAEAARAYGDRGGIGRGSTGKNLQDDTLKVDLFVTDVVMPGYGRPVMGARGPRASAGGEGGLRLGLCRGPDRGWLDRHPQTPSSCPSPFR